MLVAILVLVAGWYRKPAAAVSLSCIGLVFQLAYMGWDLVAMMPAPQLVLIVGVFIASVVPAYFIGVGLRWTWERYRSRSNSATAGLATQIANPKPRKPGITGTGEFIENGAWTLWDDTHSPSLIGYQRFDELKDLVLTEKERSKIAMYAVRDSMASKGPKHTVAEDEEAKAIFAKLNAHLVDLREKKFEQLGHWLESFLMRDKDGRVIREDDSRAANVMLSPVKAYLNCLDLWGYGYRWEEIEDSGGEPALLVRREHRTPRVILQSEVECIQGKPYRFLIQMRGTSWHFKDELGFFEIEVRGKNKSIF